MHKIRTNILKFASQLLSLSGYPLPDWASNVMRPNVGGTVYHAVERAETVKDILKNGVIKPFGGRGAVSLAAELSMNIFQFGDYVLVLDWECLQQQNMSILPLNYVDIIQQVCEDYWNNRANKQELQSLYIYSVDDLVKLLEAYDISVIQHNGSPVSDFEEFDVDESGMYEFVVEYFYEKTNNPSIYAGVVGASSIKEWLLQDEENENINTDDESLEDDFLDTLYESIIQITEELFEDKQMIEQAYPYMYDIRWVNENELRSYSPVFVNGCVTEIVTQDGQSYTPDYFFANF